MTSLMLRTTTLGRITAGAAVGTLLLSPAPYAAATPASGASAPASGVPAGASAPATAALTCGTDANPNALSHPETITSTRIGRATVSLRGGRRGGHLYLWARITGARRGDTVRLDWSDPGPGGRRHRCSATVHSGSDQHTVAAAYVQNGNSYRQFRACGHHGGVTRCTRWAP
ncbi:hypothetical protein [Streptomyces kronopolitis]|uniref:hypothetical protein n=1 Tax=Streptomyces kronopolitis TaxID=1612435 RepID=UPI0036AF5C5D